MLDRIGLLHTPSINNDNGEAENKNIKDESESWKRLMLLKY